MQLTNKQEEGLRIAVERYKHREPYTIIAGYAGSGKSTLIKFIVSALELNPEEEVAYITYTGKASEVLRSKGCANAMTAHRLLYYSKQMPNGKFFYRPRTSLDKDYKLIVVDEISMLPKDMWELLLSHDVYIIAAGDPFQLPPISKDTDNHMLDHPHIFLDEIMRQAKESDIILASMDIREGQSLKPFKGKDIQIFHKKDLLDGMYNWADQIIVSMNKTRHDINDFMRAQAGRGMEPEVGDKIICLRNCWESCSLIEDNPLINGSIGYIEDFEPDEIEYHFYQDGGFRNVKAPVLRADLTVGDDCYHNIIILPRGKNSLLLNKNTQLTRKKKTHPFQLNLTMDTRLHVTKHKVHSGTKS